MKCKLCLCVSWSAFACMGVCVLVCLLKNFPFTRAFAWKIFKQTDRMQ